MARKKLYDVLGIDEKAASGEIKRAYRRKAKKAHPDQGGTEEAFRELAQAYTTLINDDSRKFYDETGNIKDKPPENQEFNIAVQTIVNMFNQFIETHKQESLQFDIIREIRLAINEVSSKQKQEINNIRAQMRTLSEIAERLSIENGGEDFLGNVLREQIRMREQQINHLEMLIRANEKAQEILRTFKFNPKITRVNMSTLSDASITFMMRV
jgi:curved DNA-binding protein CbpA